MEGKCFSNYKNGVLANKIKMGGQIGLSSQAIRSKLCSQKYFSKSKQYIANITSISKLHRQLLPISFTVHRNRRLKVIANVTLKLNCSTLE